MAVLVEGISVIVRRDAIQSKYRRGWRAVARDGWSAFSADVPNSTLCADDEIARVGFMDPNDVEAFVARLEQKGLQFLRDGKPVDIAIADQQRGLTTECGWLEFARLECGTGKVSACWFFDGPRVAAGTHLRGGSMTVATPPEWTFEGSLSQKYTFVQTERAGDRLKFLRKENGVEVFLDLDTGKEVYSGRTS